MFEGDHDVVIDEVGDVAHKFILMIPEKSKLLARGSIAFDSHDEDADEGSNRKDGIGCQC